VTGLEFVLAKIPGEPGLVAIGPVLKNDTLNDISDRCEDLGWETCGIARHISYRELRAAGAA
jgi:hypothetical protein